MSGNYFYSNPQYYANTYYPAQQVNVPVNSIANVPVDKPMGLLGKSLIAVGAGILLVAALGIAIGIPLYVAISQATTTTTTVKTTTVTTVTTTSATTVTTVTTTSTTSTATTTTAAIATGTQDFVVELTGNGYHGVQKVRYYSATNTGSAMRFGYPIVYLSGTTFSGSYTNNAWYALHAGCGNVNGIASCTAVCKGLGKSYVGITSTCGTGYAGSVATYVNPNRAVYTSADTVSTPWADYGLATTCGNPMIYCDCTL